MEVERKLKVALITGASRGIGEAVSLHLAKVGFEQLALVARSADVLENVAAQCKNQGAKEVLVVPQDLSQPEGNERAVTEKN